MKLWHKISSILLLLAIDNIGKIKSGKLNRQKNVDEIFGEGWERRENDAQEIEQIGDKNQERISTTDQNRSDPIDCNVQEIFRRQFDDFFDGNGEEEEAEEEEEEKEEESAKESDQQKKREIIAKFNKIKEKFKQNGKHSSTDWEKIERKIGKNLGVSREKIYKWKRELGITVSKKYFKYSKVGEFDAEKREIAKKFIEMKNEFMKKERHSRKEWEQFDDQIKQKFGASRRAITNWIMKFGLNEGKLCNKSDFQKRKIIRKYFKLLNKFKKSRRHSQREWQQFQANIKQEIGICQSLVTRWKKEFGMCKKRKLIPYKVKMGKMKQYWQIKKQNLALSDVKICAMLDIPNGSLFRWKSKFNEEFLEKNDLD